MAELSPAETVRRMRAMWGYSLEDQSVFVAAIDGAAVNMLRAKAPTRAPRSVLLAAARHVGLPDSFAVDGWDIDDSSNALERIQALEDQMKTLVREPTDPQCQNVRP